MPPISTYGAQNLWNFRLLDQKRPVSEPENLCALTTFTASVDESWFYAIPTAIEARGAPIIPLALKAFQAVSQDRVDAVIACLKEISVIIEALTPLLTRMYENCHPAFFFNEIRPFLAGTTSTELVRGVYYEQRDGKGSHKSYKGPTAAQSSLFHFLDISFGIRHHPTGKAQEMNGHADATSSTDEKFLKVSRDNPSKGYFTLQHQTLTRSPGDETVHAKRPPQLLRSRHQGCQHPPIRHVPPRQQHIARRIQRMSGKAGPLPQHPRPDRLTLHRHPIPSCRQGRFTSEHGTRHSRPRTSSSSSYY